MCAVYCQLIGCGYEGQISYFFFQAEDGIRDLTVTGVQTCALPICAGRRGDQHRGLRAAPRVGRPRRHRDRKSVVWGKSVDLGGRRIIKKKKEREVSINRDMRNR